MIVEQIPNWIDGAFKEIRPDLIKTMTEAVYSEAKKNNREEPNLVDFATVCQFISDYAAQQKIRS